MALRIGIVGLPQSGKTSLFNALTGAQAPISGYATRTVQANTAVVQVPDPRLKPLAEIFKPKKVTYATVEFVDVAGMGQQDEEARKGGLSAEFLGHIRNADALAIVLRTFANENVPHPLGSIDPLRDLEQLDNELALTDLATVERRSERTAKAAKSGEKKYQQELDLLARLQEALSNGIPVRRLELNAQEEALVKELFLLTMKPRMYVLNVSEDVLAEAATLLEQIHQGVEPALESLAGELHGVAAVALRARSEEAETVAVSARLEAELSELAPEEAAEYLASLGLPKLGAERVIQVGYRLLNLITFLTVGEDEVRAWTVTKGAKAPEAAGKIHSDIERGFIRAEITHFDDFMACGGSFAAAARKGLQRLEGKDYVIQDGDIAHFRFNVGR
ncbi:MAG: redox-regulated ATPase YchF [Thermogemmatispora sp.]|jgi:GTP-binding protein YchF|uniref:Ribosome-binding ATPase YchF n=1 Tax=Thermogemmatispora aurantia TaxID=2045279 RepID=A0A5J4K8A3_9CHLR|nr:MULTISPECIES: redox-regulated ATPase YchF [Thermogemmatispora]MBE3566892.1 redox-regulated ATPase YchF [Thermogemmatispora sp.]GER84844.1 ribosome-binding ATPase YchF [Thermogemmatispora aurantia]